MDYEVLALGTILKNPELISPINREPSSRCNLVEKVFEPKYDLSGLC